MKILHFINFLNLLTLVQSQDLCQCLCPCPPNGLKLKQLINCFATWGSEVATDLNSRTQMCNESEIVYCRTTNTYDHFCKFDGTNDLQDTDDLPTCYFNCGMHACNSWLSGHTLREKQCIIDLFKNS